MHPEQQESTGLYEALAWLELHRKQVIRGAVAILAIVVALYVYFWMRHQGELKANQAVLALEPGEPGADNPGATAGDFLKVADAHGSTTAAARALLLAAGELFREGKYAEARSHFERAGAADSSGILAPMAALGAAACLDAQNQPDAAITAYQQVIARYPDEPAAARARLAIAGLHEARGDWEAALKLYEALQSSPNPGQASMEAAGRKETILKLHPELARTNAVASPATPATNVLATLTNLPAGAPGAP